jgi:hypothetical protein
LAVAVGTWSSIIVVSSFIFGIVIFEEEVKSIEHTALAFMILISGLIGMSRYAEPDSSSSSSNEQYERVSGQETNDDAAAVDPWNRGAALPPSKRRHSKTGSDDAGTASMNGIAPMEIESLMGSSINSHNEPLLVNQQKNPNDGDDDNDYHDQKKTGRVILFNGRISLTKRQLGICGAVVNGTWGGLNLIPLHYAQRDLGLTGAAYLISYASGSMMVCIAIWMGLFLYHFHDKHYHVQDALEALPKWHVKELGIPGLLAGLFYSFGNFCSILAVSYLGQGVGYSFCQGQLLVSGLWGVFYFKEIKGRDTITKWFASAVVAILGIISLSYQHGGSGGHR